MHILQTVASADPRRRKLSPVKRKSLQTLMDMMHLSCFIQFGNEMPGADMDFGYVLPRAITTEGSFRNGTIATIVFRLIVVQSTVEDSKLLFYTVERYSVPTMPTSLSLCSLQYNFTLCMRHALRGCKHVVKKNLTWASTSVSVSSDTEQHQTLLFSVSLPDLSSFPPVGAAE